MILTIQLLSSIWMMVVIWFVQLVHYPLFKYVPKSARQHYCEKHQSLISVMVIPAMLVELVSLFWLWNITIVDIYWYLSVGCLMIVWGSTFLIQVPCHTKLLVSPTDQVISRLVNTNKYQLS